MKYYMVRMIKDIEDCTGRPYWCLGPIGGVGNKMPNTCNYFITVDINEAHSYQAKANKNLPSRIFEVRELGDMEVSAICTFISA